MDITITPKKSDGVERLLEVAVSAADVRAAEASAARRYASQVRLPGFRPGKVPAAVIRKKFAPAIRQETIEAVVREAFRVVVEREQLKVVAQPHVHGLHYHDGEAMTFELHIEVRPDVALDKVSGFTVTRPSAAVTDADVDAQLERLRDQRATWAPKEGKADPGDLVTVDLSASEADGSFPEPREYQITIGEGQAIPGVEELVLETAPGETTERPVKWPEDFPDESLRGVTKTVRVTVKAVKRKEAPMLDDDFAKSVGDFETIDALRAQVRADLERHARQEADASLRTALLDQVLAENPFDLPPSWVGELVARYVEAYQVPETERDRFAEEFKPVAERQVRRDVVIELLAERHGLVPGEADVDEKVAQLAKQRGVKVGELYASLQKAGRIPVLEREIMEDRVFGWLLDRNTVVES